MKIVRDLFALVLALVISSLLLKSGALKSNPPSLVASPEPSPPLTLPSVNEMRPGDRVEQHRDRIALLHLKRTFKRGAEETFENKNKTVRISSTSGMIYEVQGTQLKLAGKEFSGKETSAELGTAVSPYLKNFTLKTDHGLEMITGIHYVGSSRFGLHVYFKQGTCEFILDSDGSF